MSRFFTSAIVVAMCLKLRLKTFLRAEAGLIVCNSILSELSVKGGTTYTK